jgi:hypothetical protein
MQKRLGVAGDSFMAACINSNDLGHENVQGNHYTEIVARLLGYDYVTYARGGSSNELIRLQVKQLIDDKVDAAIVGWSYPQRVALSFGKYKKDLGIFQTNYNEDRYNLHLSLQSNSKKFKKTSREIVSAPIEQILRNNNKHETQKNLKPVEQKYVKAYFNIAFDESWKSQNDAWLIESAILSLITAKIPTIMWIQHNEYNMIKDYLPKSEYLFENNIILVNTLIGDKQKLLNPTVPERDKYIPFHTTIESQKRLAKNNLSFLKKIIKNG